MMNICVTPAEFHAPCKISCIILTVVCPTDETTQAEPTAETEEQDEATQRPSLEEMLQASGSIAAPTLVPTAAPTSLQTPAGSDTSQPQTPVSEDTSNVEAAAGEFQDAQETPEEDCAPNRPDGSAADATSAQSASVPEERPSEAEGGAAAGADGNMAE